MASMTTDGELPDTHIAHNFAFTSSPAKQSGSPLFSILPGEIRDRIMEYVLADYEDTANSYPDMTSYKRPGRLAPRRTDSAVLQTCQAIYREAWFRPWTGCAEHTFWLTSPERMPEKATKVDKMAQVLALVKDIHGEVPVMEGARVFAQLWALEPGNHLNEVLNMPHFQPQVFTITLRHTDWWWWEDDATMSIKSMFVDRCRFPDSVKEISMELESVERRKDQVDSIAEQIASQWQFTRKDGTRLAVNPETAPEITRWTGTSAWENHRWIRDESRPGQLDYYMVTLTWTSFESDGGLPDPPTKAAQIFATRGTNPSNRGAVSLFRSLEMWEMERANVTLNTPAQEAIKLITEARRARAEEIRAQRSAGMRRSQRLSPRRQRQ